MSEEHLERLPAYVPGSGQDDKTQLFKIEWRNETFSTSGLTWATLLFLIVLFPVANFVFSDDPSAMLKSLDDSLRLYLFIGTIVIQWMIFLFIFGTVYAENTGLKGVGYRRLRWIDFLYAGAFFMVAALFLSGLGILLEKLGLPMSGELKFLIPHDPTGRVVWILLSLTAGFCEETAFRGYLMTRLRLVGKFNSWLVPTIISALVFGSLHTYQGLPGFIIITVYGAMFSVLFIYTKSIWPGIIAHFFQDLINIFIPQ